MRVNRGSHEHGFTIVEVLVAALIVTMVFAGAVYFMVGAGHSQQKTLVRARMAAAADGIVQKVRADRTWVTPACQTRGCNLTSARFQPASGGSKGPDLKAVVAVTPVDSDGDGQGANDEDGVRPDFYRIQVRVDLAPGEAAEWGDQKTFETVSTVDATALGVATGTLVIQTGETTNQVDDRMAISGVRSAGDLNDMHRQPEPCNSPFPITLDDWANHRPILPLGCNSTIDAARSTKDYLGQVDLRAVTNVDFRITRVNSDGVSSASRRASDADGGGPSANGTYTFSGLPAGSYTITVTPPRNRQLWKTKMNPSNGIAAVQANQKAHALIMVRPTQGTGEYHVQFTRQVYLYHLTLESPPPVVGTYTQSGVTIEVTTHYLYLVADGPRKERWAGPVWNGLMVMEPKPFDRYRPSGTGVGAAAQNTVPAMWDGRNLFAASSSDPNKDGWFTFFNLPTGLHSSPRQQPAPTAVPPDQVGMWGDFDDNEPTFGWRGRRSQSCDSSLTPGGSCGNFAWISHLNASLGKPNGAIHYYSPNGECYLESSVPGISFARRLQNGAERGARCDRTYIYYNPETGNTTRIPGFLPDKNGNGGGRMVWKMWQTSRCIANCGVESTPGTGVSESPDPSSGGSGATTGGRNDPPPQPPKEAPPVDIVKVVDVGGTPTRQKTTIGAAPAVAMPQTNG